MIWYQAWAMGTLMPLASDHRIGDLALGLGIFVKIAVIGSGAAGMMAAWGLSSKHDVTTYEKDAAIGGHVNTITTDCFDKNHTFDNGFVVFNYETYPIFIALLEKLGLKPSRAKMSISISGGNTFTICEDIKQVFLANKFWMLDPRVFWLLANIIRFHSVALRDIKNNNVPDVTICEYLKIRRFSARLFNNYLGPVAAAVWVASPQDVGEFPAYSFLKFFQHHNMLGFRKFKWFTVKDGSQQYIDAIAKKLPNPVKMNCAATQITKTPKGIEVSDSQGESNIYDQLVFACNPNIILKIFTNPSPQEAQCLGTFQFKSNRTICHRDPALMPERPGAWSSWNCHYKTNESTGLQNMAISYFLNSLYKTDRSNPVFLTISPHLEPRPELVITQYDWAHPLFSRESIAAQKQLARIQGKNGIWYAGAWRGAGFHEDAIGSGLSVARDLGGDVPGLPEWKPPDW